MKKVIVIVSLFFAGIFVSQAQVCDILKLKTVKTHYGDLVGSSYYKIGELNGAVLNADTLSAFAPEYDIINISNDTFSSNVKYDIIAVFFLYADTVLLLKDTFGGLPISMGRELFPNDTMNFSLFFYFFNLINYLKDERGINLEQISYWKMVSGVRYTSKDGTYSDSVFYTGADTVTFRVVRGSVGIVEGKHADLPIQVYPNPTKNQLKIENGELKISTIEIYDVLGKCVGTNLRVCPDSDTIDVSHLAKGIYYLKIDNKVVKFVKE